MEDISIIQLETDELVKNAYLKLRDNQRTSDDVQDLENLLSTKIFETEGLIQQGKKEKKGELIDELHRRRTILKRIADGLAWFMLDNNSERIHAYSIGHESGFMAGKQGYRFERNVISALYKLPNVQSAIQCDITNVLRLSDVLVVLDDGQIVPIEVKGRRSGRAQRQKKQAQKIIELIRTGEYNGGWEDYAPLRAQSVSVKFQYYFDELERLSLNALKEGLAWEIFDDCIVYIVLNPKVTDQKNIMNVIGKLNWSRQKVTISSLGRHISKDASILLRTRLPLTIFSISPSIGLKYILGELDAVIVLDKSRVLSRLGNEGLESRLNQDGSASVISKLGIGFTIMDAWDKILNELVSISSFIEYTLATSNKIDELHSPTSM